MKKENAGRAGSYFGSRAKGGEQNALPFSGRAGSYFGSRAKGGKQNALPFSGSRAALLLGSSAKSGEQNALPFSGRAGFLFGSSAKGGEQNDCNNFLSSGGGQNGIYPSPLAGEGLGVRGKKTAKGFTLAEVLITLVIIGVIAALTVPALIQRTQKQELVTALKKAYSVFSNATNQIIAEEGAPRCDEGGWGCDGSTKHFYEYYKKHLNVLKDCGTEAGCFPQKGAPDGRGTYKQLNGYSGDNWETLGGTQYRKLILSDGMQIMFSFAINSCSAEGHGSTGMCAVINVDVNGVKGPNTVGRDVFSFVLKNTGLYPRGCDSDYCIGSDGSGCTCRVIRENAMNY